MEFNVYGIFCNKNWKVYYGSTKQTINERLSNHKSEYKRFLKGERGYYYCSSFEIIKNNDYRIELLESCFHVPHMIEMETYYFDNFKCVNIYRPGIPGRTKKEYYEDNKESIVEKSKEYYQDNKESIGEKKKLYQENNKDSITEYQKQYREDNKESISEKKKELYTCECGVKSRISHKSRHEKSIRHKCLLDIKRML